MDIATLGYAVDTSSVRAGTADLDAHAKAAGQAATSAQGFTDKSAQGVPVHDRTTTSISSQREQFRALAEAAAMTGGPLGDMINRSGLLYLGSLRVSPALIGVTLGVSAVTAAVVKSIAAYSEFEQWQAQTTNALQATGGASGQTTSSLKALTTQIVATGTQSVSSVQAAEAELLKFRGVSGDVFTKTLKLSQDLAATGFTDLSGAAKALGGALQDPRTATEQLKGVSLKLSTAQQRLVTDLYNSGKASQAIQVILKAVSDQVGGANAKSADTLSGAWGRLTASGGKVLEQWGETLNSGWHLKDNVDALAGTFDRLAKSMAEAEKHKGISADYSMPNYIPGVDMPIYVPPAPPAGPSLYQQGLDKLKRGQGASVNAPSMAGFSGYPTADEEKQRTNFEAVNDALKEQMKTAGMSAQQMEVYRNVVAATALGNDKLSVSLRSQISAQVNAINAAKDTRAIVDAGKTQVANLQIEAESFNMTAGAAAAYNYEQQALAAERIKGIDLSAKQIAQIHDEAQALAQATQAYQHLKDAKQAADAVNSAMVDGLYDVVTGAKTAAAAIHDLTNSILKMVMQALLAGQGPLAGLFNTTARGGVIGGLRLAPRQGAARSDKEREEKERENDSDQRRKAA